MHRYRWLLIAAFTASAAIFGVAYRPSTTPALPRVAPVFDVAQRHVAATVKGLRSAAALSHGLGAFGNLGPPRTASNVDADLSQQAATLARLFAPVAAALRRGGVPG